MNKDRKKIRIKTRYDEIKQLKYETEKQHHENLLKYLKIDSEYYRKKYKNLNKKEALLIIIEILLGLGSTISNSTMSLINPRIGIVLTTSTAL